MTYKGYRIMAVGTRTVGWEVDKAGNRLNDANPEQLETVPMSGWSEWDYGVVDSDGYVMQSFETIAECKDYIKEEL